MEGRGELQREGGSRVREEGRQSQRDQCIKAAVQKQQDSRSEKLMRAFLLLKTKVENNKNNKIVKQLSEACERRCFTIRIE